MTQKISPVSRRPRALETRRNREDLTKCYASIATHYLTKLVGFERIINTKSPFQRLIWIALVIAALIFMVAEIVLFMQEYLKYQVTTSTTLTARAQLDFPAVTFCNKNPINIVRLHNLLQKNSSVIPSALLNTLEVLQSEPTTRRKFCAAVHEEWQKKQQQGNGTVSKVTTSAPTTMNGSTFDAAWQIYKFCEPLRNGCADEQAMVTPQAFELEQLAAAMANVNVTSGDPSGRPSPSGDHTGAARRIPFPITPANSHHICAR